MGVIGLMLYACVSLNTIDAYLSSVYTPVGITLPETVTHVTTRHYV